MKSDASASKVIVATMLQMPSGGRALDRAKQRANRARHTIGDEIRTARLAAGTSQSAVGLASHLSQPVISRIERGGFSSVSLDKLFVVADAVGLDLSIKAYPGRNPTRDAAHARKLSAFLACVAPPLRYATEVALPAREGATEQRAWDAMLFARDGETGVELEMRLYDVQAQARRILLKWRDSGADRLLLLVNDSHSNRRVLRSFPEYFAALPRLRTASVLRSLANGERPPTGLVLV